MMATGHPIKEDAALAPASSSSTSGKVKISRGFTQSNLSAEIAECECANPVHCISTLRDTFLDEFENEEELCDKLIKFDFFQKGESTNHAKKDCTQHARHKMKTRVERLRCILDQVEGKTEKLAENKRYTNVSPLVLFLVALSECHGNCDLHLRMRGAIAASHDCALHSKAAPEVLDAAVATSMATAMPTTPAKVNPVGLLKMDSESFTQLLVQSLEELSVQGEPSLFDIKQITRRIQGLPDGMACSSAVKKRANQCMSTLVKAKRAERITTEDPPRFRLGTGTDTAL